MPTTTSLVTSLNVSLNDLTKLTICSMHLSKFDTEEYPEVGVDDAYGLDEVRLLDERIPYTAHGKRM